MIAGVASGEHDGPPIGRLVDERWAEIASAEEIETIKYALQSLLGKLQGEDGTMIGSKEQAGS
jgi:hypothetical protein